MARKAKKKAAPSGGLFSRVSWLFLALVTGGGGGYFSEDALKIAAKKLADKGVEVLKEKVAARRNPGSTGRGTDAIKVYFTTPEVSASASAENNPGMELAAYIDQAKKTLDVCAFELDNKTITEALVRATQRNVRVRLVTETNYLEESGVKALKAVGVPVIDDKRPGALMHNKFIVFDNEAVWTGSMNFTQNCVFRNNNNGFYIADARLAANYATKFSWMFDQHKFGGAPSKSSLIPNPTIILADGTKVENYFSTHDRVAQRVVEAVSKAKKSIHFMAFSFTHDGIGDAMLARSRAGVEVSGIFEKTQMTGTHCEYHRMAQAGLAVFPDGNPRNMHHKVIVIDGEVVIAGSFNFSDSADKSNDENLVVMHNSSIARAYEDEFQRVMMTARQGQMASAKK
ncbi:MAG: phospholipase D-like domain-containing protein [Gemmataceae bacterium]